MNPVDDTREGIEKYLKRNPTTCFLAYINDDTGNDKRIAVRELRADLWRRQKMPCAKRVSVKYSAWFLKIMMWPMISGKNRDIRFGQT